MSPSPLRRIAYTIATIAILLPIAIMFWNIEAGAALLLLGLVIANRAIRYGAYDDSKSMSDATRKQLSRHQSERGQTIFVQVVDDFGRDLPPVTVQKLMADAQAKASPRDMVVPVRYKISNKDDTHLRRE